MDKIEKYKDIIEEELSYRKAVKIANAPQLKRHLIMNEERTQFILMDIGWFKKRYLSDVIFHIGIVDDKVWLHNNFTDIDIAGQLAKSGISKSDIVLAFLPKFIQETTEYAVA
ncbi:MAG: element excision factor XisI family protein [Bacteroidota bacterium]